MISDEITKIYDQTPVLWSELKEKKVELAARNVLRSASPNPQMLTEAGFTQFCKLLKSTPSTYYFQLVIFDKSWLLRKLKAEFLNPLGLNCSKQLADALKGLEDDL